MRRTRISTSSGRRRAVASSTTAQPAAVIDEPCEASTTSARY
ncbi:MAG: hypothetical protein ACRDRJ_24300 [Streptosporangiaceae bacterium]